MTETSSSQMNPQSTDTTKHASPSESAPLKKQSGLRPMERIMLLMAGFYVAGVLIFGFLEGPVRGIAMTLFVCAFTYFLFSPICTRDKVTRSK